MKTIDELVIDIKGFMGNLNQPLLSEIQLEVLLALHLKQTGKYDEVYAEYTFPTSVFEDSYPFGERNDKISIDLVVLKNGQYIPIELKYKTEEYLIQDFNLFGSEKRITLATQGARNNTSYDFWKDIKRLEMIKERFKAVEAGIVLFVTNDGRYKNEPERGAQYAPFSTHQGATVQRGTVLKWDETKNRIADDRRRRFPEFEISNKYTLDWIDLDSKKPRLHYLLTII
jgi:hypothetical protein